MKVSFNLLAAQELIAAARKLADAAICVGSSTMSHTRFATKQSEFSTFGMHARPH